MPEGDTVWLTAQRLREALEQRTLTRAELRVPRLAGTDLTGRVVLAVLARGKHLLLRFEGGWTLHTHLRMDGAWHVYGSAESWRGGPHWQVRAILGTIDRVAVGYRLPVLEMLHTRDEEQAVGHLGPDLLGPDWDGHEARRRLLSDPLRPVGEALLDQRNLAGIGNVYACELCFLRGVTPWTPIGRAGDPERLVALAKRLLEANKNRTGHITTGDSRPGQRNWVHGCAGRPCRRCGTTVLRASHGGDLDQRVAFWCPRCQRGPAPEPISTPLGVPPR